MLSSADAERVAELMRETAATELLPRFRSLAKEDIRLKGPGDFVTVADAGSVSRAAVQLQVTQPALSRQLRDLESELGLPLFDRVGRRLHLTAEG